MQQGEMLYEGKAKQVFLTDDPDMILIHYKDAATAFNNIKKATIENKGVLNNRISTLIFEYLNKQGIKTHYVKTLNDRDQLCRRVRIIPLEVIVRNVIAGSMAQRLGIEEGTKPSNVIFDICYKIIVPFTGKLYGTDLSDTISPIDYTTGNFQSIHPVINTIKHIIPVEQCFRFQKINSPDQYNNSNNCC